MGRWFKRKAPLVLVLAVILPLLLGCVHSREWSLDLAKSEVKNTINDVAVSKELLKAWAVRSGEFRGALGDRIKEFPVRAVEAWAELDCLSYRAYPDKWPSSYFKPDTCQKDKALTDFEHGYHLGAQIRMLYETVIETFKQFAPDLLARLPAKILGVL